MHILLAGGSGFLGSYLIKKLIAQGCGVTLLTRYPAKTDAQPKVKIIYWDGHSIQIPPHEKPIDIVINLCGLSIARWWTQHAKQAIRDSRIVASQTLVKWCLSAEKRPKAFIQISGIDYYNMQTMQCTEHDPCGSSFLAKLSKDWEDTTLALQESPTRLVIARLAPVLAKTHPPLQPLLLSTQCYLGAIIGNGKQYFSWIHHEDFTCIISEMIKNDTFSGIYNVCAPNPIPYKVFIQTLADVTHRPVWLKLPSWLLKRALGEMATLVIDSRKVTPKKLMEHPYTFQFPEIQKALNDIIRA